MPAEAELDIPPAWEQFPLAGMAGVLLVLGGVDTGKSTLARYLFQRLQALHPQPHSVAFIDGDPGQTSLGPPTTLTLAFELPPGEGLAQGDCRRYFVGSTSPAGHLLVMLAGAGKLAQAARQAGAQVIVYDTSGLLGAGGLDLKRALLDSLQPAAVFALQRQGELEALIAPQRRSRRAQVFALEPSPAVQRRSPGRRQAHRAGQYARYFEGARPQVVSWQGLAVFPLPRFSLGRLLAIEDEQGFTLALAVITGVDRDRRLLELFTPFDLSQPFNALHLGDISLDLQDFHDHST